MLAEIAKLQRLRRVGLPADLFRDVPPKLVATYRQRDRRAPARVARPRSMVDLLIGVVHKIGVKAEHKVDRELLDDFKRVTGKTTILYHLAEASLDHPD